MALEKLTQPTLDIRNIWLVLLAAGVLSISAEQAQAELPTEATAEVFQPDFWPETEPPFSTNGQVEFYQGNVQCAAIVDYTFEQDTYIACPEPANIQFNQVQVPGSRPPIYQYIANIREHRSASDINYIERMFRGFPEFVVYIQPAEGEEFRLDYFDHAFTDNYLIWLALPDGNLETVTIGGIPLDIPSISPEIAHNSEVTLPRPFISNTPEAFTERSIVPYVDSDGEEYILLVYRDRRYQDLRSLRPEIFAYRIDGFDHDAGQLILTEQSPISLDFSELPPDLIPESAGISSIQQAREVVDSQIASFNAQLEMTIISAIRDLENIPTNPGSLPIRFDFAVPDPDLPFAEFCAGQEFGGPCLDAPDDECQVLTGCDPETGSLACEEIANCLEEEACPDNLRPNCGDIDARCPQYAEAIMHLEIQPICTENGWLCPEEDGQLAQLRLACSEQVCGESTDFEPLTTVRPNTCEEQNYTCLDGQVVAVLPELTRGCAQGEFVDRCIVDEAEANNLCPEPVMDAGTGDDVEMVVPDVESDAGTADIIVDAEVTTTPPPKPKANCSSLPQENPASPKLPLGLLTLAGILLQVRRNTKKIQAKK